MKGERLFVGGRVGGYVGCVSAARRRRGVPRDGARRRGSRQPLLAGERLLVARAVRGGQPVAIASRQRLKATRLGDMLYGVARDFLAASGTDVERAATPSPDADWKVTPPGAGRSSSRRTRARERAGRERRRPDPRPALRRRPRRARFRVRARRPGCRRFPEAQLDVERQAGEGQDAATAQVRGVLDGHMHWMTFEYLGGNFHCGRPWSPYGIPVALPDCSSIEGPQGTRRRSRTSSTTATPSTRTTRRLAEADRLGAATT